MERILLTVMARIICFTQSGGKLTIELIHDGYEKKYRQFVIRSGGREQTVSFTGEALKVKL